MARSKEVLLNTESAYKIKNWGERVFAIACTSKPHLKVYYQIPVREKVIDFLIKNTNLNGKSKGKLVEVTKMPYKRINKSKRRQKTVMVESGLPNTILYRENLTKIEDSLKTDEEQSPPCAPGGT